MAVRVVVSGWSGESFLGTVEGGTVYVPVTGPVGHGAPIMVVYDETSDHKEAKKLRDKLEKSGYRRVATALETAKGLVKDEVPFGSDSPTDR